MLRIQQSLASFAGQAKLKTWAFAIANHVVTDYLRQPARRLKVVEMDEAADVFTSIQKWHLFYSKGP